MECKFPTGISLSYCVPSEIPYCCRFSVTITVINRINNLRGIDGSKL